MNDLTRWNRAGLARFRYVDANAATYLEDLRLAMLSRLIDVQDGQADNWQWWRDLWADVPVDAAVRSALDPLLQSYLEKLSWTDLWTSLPPRGEAPDQREDRLLTQYRGARRDFGWEIQRALARALHVLTEHIDAYANEGYLGTATQWENVRRLVTMLDYHPAPPASAETHLAIEAKAAGNLEEGFQVKFTPENGDPPIFFETLADVDVDTELNEIRAVNWDRSQEPLEGNTFELEGKIEGPNIRDPVVFERESDGLLVALSTQGLAPEEEKTTLTTGAELDVAEEFIKGYTYVNLEPKDRLNLIGPLATTVEHNNRLMLKSRPMGLEEGTVLYIDNYIDDIKHARYRQLSAVAGYEITLVSALDAQLDITKATVSRARVEVNLTWNGTGSTVTIPGDLTSMLDATVAGRISGSLLHGTVVLSAVYTPVTPTVDDSGFTTLTLSSASLKDASALYLPPVTTDWEVDSYLELGSGDQLPATIETSAPKKLSAGDLIVIESGDDYAWGEVESLSIDENDVATIVLTNRRTNGSGPWYSAQSKVLGHFKRRVRPYAWQNNTDPLISPVPITAEGVKAGATLILEGPSDPSLVTITDVVGQDMFFTPLPDTGYTLHNSFFRGNLVKAGHGKSKPEKVLGSGDAVQTNQSFLLQEKDVSFQSDPTFATGVKASVAVRIGTQTWVQTSSLRDSEAADPHYSVAMTEEGYLEISFGDGRYGRRLPTGSNNVRVGFRVGTGLAGILPAGSLVKPSKPHWLAAKVHQPMDTTGGGEMEAVEDLRKNAPSTVLTLERAVSASDFAALVQGRSSIWQARAFERPTRRGTKIELVVVPAGGGLIDDEGKNELLKFIRAHAVPGVDVEVSDYNPHNFKLNVEIRVRIKQFDPEQTKADVRTALESAFALQNRELGQPVYLSEVYGIVEGITGVENSHCILAGDATLEKITPDEREVAFLESGFLTLTYEEFSL